MPLRTRKLWKAEVRMKTEAHRDRAFGAGEQHRFEGEAAGTKGHRQLNAVAKREDRKKINCGPLEPCGDKILSRFGHYPGKQRPRHPVHWKPMLVEMKKWR